MTDCFGHNIFCHVPVSYFIFQICGFYVSDLRVPYVEKLSQIFHIFFFKYFLPHTIIKQKFILVVILYE